MVKAKAKQTKKSGVPRPSVRKAAPVAYSRRVVTSPSGPSITRSSAGCRIKHREYVAPIVAKTVSVAPFTDGFEVASWPVNPGLASLFPWLSPVANQYELYRFHALKFHYVGRVGSTTGGVLRMAFDHDAMDDDPSTRDVMMSYAGASSDVLWKEQTLQIPASRLDLGMPNGRYTRMGVHAISDLKTYDCGKLLIAVTGTAVAQELGELYVEYDVELMVPQRRATTLSGVIVGGGGNVPDAVATDKRILAIVDRPILDIAGTLPATITDAVDKATGQVYNLIKFVAPFTGLFTTQLEHDESASQPVPAASLVLESASGPATVEEAQAFRDVNGQKSRTMNQWILDVLPGTLLKLYNGGSFPSAHIAKALLAYTLLSRSALPKYEM